MIIRRLLLAGALGVSMVGLLVAPAMAGEDRPFRDRDRRVSLSGGVVVAANERIDGVVISFDGDVRINGVVDNDVYVGRGDLVVTGTVNDDVVVLRGDAIITGRVKGDLVVIDGRAIVREGATVDGDVESGDRAEVAGTVEGEVNDVDVDSLVGGVVLGLLAFLWLSITIAVAVLGLLFVTLFPRAADAAVAAGQERVGASFGWGALIGIVGPILGFAIVSTILGIPLGIGVLGVLGIVGLLGYVTACFVLGRLMVKGTTSGARIGAFFAGFGIFRVVAIIPGVGFLVGFLASIFGIGAITLAAWRSGRASGPRPAVGPAAPAPPATPEPAPPAKGKPTAKTAPATKTTAAAKATPATKATAAAKAKPAKATPATKATKKR